MTEHNHPGEDILEGMRFSATLQLRTPLAILMQDGEVLPVGVAPPPPPQRWMGVWMEKTRAVRALGMDLPELRPTVASYIGPVFRDEYLPFLKAIRGPYEASDEAGVRDACTLPKFQDFVMRHGGVSNILSELGGNYQLLAEKQ